MIVCALLCVLGALITGEAKVLSSRVSVEEGRTLTLRCVFPGSHSSDMQWLTPGGYVAFFNSVKVLKDRRFWLIKSSPNRLVIRILNITKDDEGVYTCLHYNMPVRTKEVNVTVWAAPSKPVIDVIQIPGKFSKDEIVLNCSTSRSRPCPRITWLVGHTELSGNRKVSFEGDDKKCTASSTLRINAFTHRSAVTCVVRHRSFSIGNATATFNFSNLVAATVAGDALGYKTTDQTPHSPEVIRPVMNQTGGHHVTTMGRIKERTASEITSTMTSEWSTTWKKVTPNEHEENITTATGFLGGGDLPDGDNTTKQNWTTGTVTYNAFTDGNTTHMKLDNVTKINLSRTVEFEASKGKSNSTIILVLVSLMICVLLVTVHLFLMKLKKAHESWKKENENSDQTLESNKSRSNNEDAPGPARNGHASTNQNGGGIKYNNQVSM
ncbi:cytotoxic and regulatory T-cell molecule [Pyxicephalus adspersus]|uniref:cytotoxic and regulatory T-cell molecule n=1 Tax=Pyxicephalus adspersus TaxID=30357 RepID=UPI003B5B2D50